MPLLTLNFEPGTTGEVEFICETFRFDTEGNEIGAPFIELLTVDGTPETITLISGEDPDVTPNPWSYTVKLRLNGQDEFLCTLTMPMTAANFTDLVNIDGPVTPEWFVLKSEFLAAIADLEVGPGGGLTQEEADLLYDPLGAADDEETRATAAELALDGRLDTEEATSATLTAGLAAEITNRTSADAAEVTARNAAIAVETAARMADVDAEEARALAAEALKAPIASPALTGNPTAPTPTAGDDDTSIATTQFVQAAILTAVTAAVDALVDGAPGALNTLNELAAALADDAAFSATVTAAIAAKVDKATLTTDGDLLTRVAGAMARLTRADLAADSAFTSVYATITNLALKAPLASPALTGNPTAPTQTPGNNSTRIATTAYADAATAVEAARAAAAEILLAPVASPTFTGDPKAPTPATADNDTSIATTAWGQTNFGLLVPKSLFAAKGNIAIATGASTPAAHAAPSTGQFLVGDTAQADGWASRVLAYTDMWTLPRWQITFAAQTITTGTTGEILNTTPTEVLDTHGFHSTLSNQERIVIPAGLGGTYLIMPKVSWQTTAGATGYRRVNIDIGLGTTTETVYIVNPASNTAINFGCSLIVDLVAGDILRLEAIHTQGSDLTATGSNWSGIRIGP